MTGAGEREDDGSGGNEGGRGGRGGVKRPGSISGRMGMRARAEL